MFKGWHKSHNQFVDKVHFVIYLNKAFIGAVLDYTMLEKAISFLPSMLALVQHELWKFIAFPSNALSVHENWYSKQRYMD